MKKEDQIALFRVILKSNQKATKVLFFLTSYRAPWFVYTLSIYKLRRNGYEVVVYDFKDEILDNDNPQILIDTVNNLNEDMQGRVKEYEKRGIHIFDGVGSSLGSFLLYNYAVRYPLRKLALNIVTRLANVIFGASDENILKTRQSYVNKGYNLRKLEEAWKEIDSPSLGSRLKSKETLVFTALNDKYVTRASSEAAIRGIKSSQTHLKVVQNQRSGHTTSVLKNAHSKILLDFLLHE